MACFAGLFDGFVGGLSRLLQGSFRVHGVLGFFHRLVDGFACLLHGPFFFLAAQQHRGERRGGQEGCHALLDLHNGFLSMVVDTVTL